MPSDEKSQGALEALAGPRGRFDETLTLSIEEIQGFLSTHRDPDEDRTDRVAHELGAFATVCMGDVCTSLSRTEQHLTTLAAIEAAYLSAKTGAPESPQQFING